MKKRILILLTLVVFGVNVYAQSELPYESLQRITIQNNRDTITIIALNELAFRLRNREPQRALEYALRADSIASFLHFIKGNASSLSILGILSKNKGDYEKALNYHQRALTLRREIEDRKGVVGSYNNIGNIYKLQGSYIKAVENFEAALSVIRSHLKNNEKLEAVVQNNIGISLMNLGEYDRAMQYVDQSLLIRRKYEDELGIANSLLDLFDTDN